MHILFKVLLALNLLGQIQSQKWFQAKVYNYDYKLVMFICLYVYIGWFIIICFILIEFTSGENIKLRSAEICC